MSRRCRRKPHNEIRHKVGDQDICLIVNTLCKVSVLCDDLIRETVLFDVLIGHPDRIRVYIDPQRLVRSEKDSGDREDACARSDIQDLYAAASVCQDLLKCLNAHRGRLMQPASESHTRIHLYDEIFRLWIIILPARPDNYPLADPRRLEELLPLVQPLAVVTCCCFTVDDAHPARCIFC